MDDETPDMGDVWKIVNRELRARHLSWAELGRGIGASDQVLHNWKARQKVPPARYLDVAGFFGWSVERLTGHAAEPDRPAPLPAPEPVYTKRANDIARAFDELKDPAVRQKAYALVMGQLQMAKAGQRLPETAPQPEREPTPPTQKTRQLEPIPKRTPGRDR